MGMWEILEEGRDDYGRGFGMRGDEVEEAYKEGCRHGYEKAMREVRVDPGFRYSLNISLFRKDKYWIRTITDRVTGEILYETKTRQCFPDNRTIYTELEYGLFGSSIYHPNHTIQRNKQ